MRRTRGAQLRQQLAADRRAECARVKLRRAMIAARSITRASTVATRVFGNLPQECIIRIFEFKRRLELGHRLLWFRCWRLELDMWSCCWQQLWGTIVPPGQRVWGGVGPAAGCSAAARFPSVHYADRLAVAWSHGYWPTIPPPPRERYFTCCDRRTGQ